jgi:hypothetical protein
LSYYPKTCNFTICSIFSNSGHVGWCTASPDTILKLDTLVMIQAKFGFNWSSSFRGEDFWKSLWRTTDGWTDGRTPSDGKSSHGLWPGELKKAIFGSQFYPKMKQDWVLILRAQLILKYRYRPDKRVAFGGRGLIRGELLYGAHLIITWCSTMGRLCTWLSLGKRVCIRCCRTTKWTIRTITWTAWNTSWLAWLWRTWKKVCLFVYRETQGNECKSYLKIWLIQGQI